MEITSFILGMLTIIGMAAAVVIVLGLVKIYKQSKKVEQLENAMYKEIEQLYRNADEFNKDIHQRIDILNRDLDQRIDHINRDLNQHIDHIEEHIFKSIEEEKRDTISYVDSRIDKLQSKKEATK